MEYRNLGTSGLKVSTCCLGTMTFGEQNAEAEGHEQMDYAVERGVNFIDTAELYPIPPKPETQGKTEEIVGTWFKARQNRDKIILATKISGRSSMTWMRKEDVPELRITKDQIDSAVEDSLKRLQTDYIDLYQLHWPDRPAPIFGHRPKREEYDVEYEGFANTLHNLEEHVKKGNIRHVGLSNETPYGTMKFLQAAESSGLPRMQSVQNVYNLVSRVYEQGLDEVSLRENIGLLAYSPLAQGYLTGKYRNGALPKGSRKQLFERLDRYEKPSGIKMIDAYVALAEERGLDPAQMAIKFCDTRPFTTSTIIGATKMDQLKTCIDAFDMTWTEELEVEINALHESLPNPCP